MSLHVADFDFHLPPELIAQAPPAVRGTSRMLALERATNTLTDDLFANLSHYLRPGDLLILNDSRVLPARLYATRAGLHAQAKTGAPTARIEVLLTAQQSPNQWSALVKPGRKVPVGETLTFGDSMENELRAEVTAAGNFGERTLNFAPNPNFFPILERIGHIPLPPYIHRADTPADRSRYQTIYAAGTPGSAAAPTAGLHFTPAILQQLAANNIVIRYITLHVGLGTFQPLRVSRLEDIRLHSEHYTLPASTVQSILEAKQEGRRILAAGTTTTRTLEHCATVNQLHPHSGSTSIFISPGYRFQLVQGLLTNFHLPQSSLLMLVSAFAGREPTLAAYAHAVAHRYRFFSYGDCMFLT